MSGGSFNYLFTRVRSLGEQRTDLQRMAEALEALPWAAQAAAATRRCLTMVDEAEALAETLTDVWHAVEWWHSGDWGEEAVREPAEGYRVLEGEQQPQYRLPAEIVIDRDDAGAPFIRIDGMALPFFTNGIVVNPPSLGSLANVTVTFLATRVVVEERQARAVDQAT